MKTVWNKKFRLTARLAKLCFFLGLIACSREAVLPVGEPGADDLYQKGIAYWQSEQIDAAQYYFQKSVEKDSIYAPGYEGLARVALYKRQTTNAWLLVQKSLLYHSDWIPSILIKAEIQYERRDFNEAIAGLKKILSIHKKDESVLKDSGDLEKVLVLLAKCYRVQGKYQEALTAISVAVRENLQSKYYRSFQESLQLSIAALENMPRYIKDMAGKKTINRGELAALIYEWFPKELKAEKRWIEPPNDVTNDRLYQREILASVAARLIPVYPDGSYRPQRKIKRDEFALIMQRLIEYIKGHNHKLITEAVAAPLCNDVPKTRYYYQAVQIMAAHKIITIGSDRLFHPEQFITGMESVIAVYHTKKLMDSAL